MVAGVRRAREPQHRPRCLARESTLLTPSLLSFSPALTGWPWLQLGFNGLEPFQQITGHTQSAQCAEGNAQVGHGAGDRSAVGQAGGFW